MDVLLTTGATALHFNLQHRAQHQPLAVELALQPGIEMCPEPYSKLIKLAQTVNPIYSKPQGKRDNLISADTPSICFSFRARGL